MKVLLIPGGDQTVAATRLRALLPLPYIRRAGIDVVVGAAKAGYDVIWLQKKLTTALLNDIESVKELNSKVRLIYDIDDLGPNVLNFWFQSEINLKRVFGLADRVMTDTATRAAYLSRRYGVDAAVIPDSLDSPGQLVAKNRHRTRIANGLWFGNFPNFSSISQFVSLLSAAGIGLQIVTSVTGVKAFERPTRNNLVRAYEYQQSLMPLFYAMNDFSIMSHFGDEFTEMKSTNKMVASLCHGLPSLVSSTPEYKRLAEELRIPEVLFDDNQDSFSKALAAIANPEFRKEIIKRSEPLLEMYHPAAIAQQMVALFREIK